MVGTPAKNNKKTKFSRFPILFFYIFVSMAGLYFHIPFCKRICAYCDFHRCADLRLIPSAIEAMHRELEDSATFLHERNIATIYFGGGTPSLLDPAELQRFIDHTSQLLDTSQVSEITAEMNPDDITAEYVAKLRSTDINRISLGVQSFDDAALRLMNRRHTGAEVADAVKRLQDAGYGNITTDLIFGIEGFGTERLERDIEQMLRLGVQHISAYHLTIEPSTRFGRMVERGEFRAVCEEQSEQEFALLHHRLSEAGYEHYEVSNYALPNHRSRHNSSYWLGAEYLGIGTGAHSFNGEVRRWCEQPVTEYISQCLYEEETLSDTDHYNEMIMTSLRRVEGIDLALVTERFGAERAVQLEAQSRQFEGVAVEIEGGKIRIPPEKMLLSDMVIEALFEV